MGRGGHRLDIPHFAGARVKDHGVSRSEISGYSAGNLRVRIRPAFWFVRRDVGDLYVGSFGKLVLGEESRLEFVEPHVDIASADQLVTVPDLDRYTITGFS